MCIGCIVIIFITSNSLFGPLLCLFSSFMCFRVGFLLLLPLLIISSPVSAALYRNGEIHWVMSYFTDSHIPKVDCLPLPVRMEFQRPLSYSCRNFDVLDFVKVLRVDGCNTMPCLEVSILQLSSSCASF